jgi:crotonobetainyl-CoA:carnitine CoA-transferase CaiB-like acyl-CoA transferase
VAWSSKPSPQPELPPGDLPLEGLRVTDLTAFWAGPSATLLLASLGADVIKVEGVKRPDGMRFAAGKPPTFDGWWETGGMFLATNPNKRSLSLELTTPEGQSVAQTLVRASDIVIENFSVRVIGQLGLDWARVTAANPKAIMVRMPAFGLDGPWRDRVGFAQTMEQVSGLAWMTGEVDEPPVIPRGACDPIAGLHAVFAALVALRHREVTGQGSLVEVTMVEAALNIASPVVIERSAYGKSLHRGGNRSWSDAPQGVYPCAGDESWVAITVESDQDWSALRDVLDAGELLSSPALQETTGRRAAADHLDKVIESWTRKRSREHVVNALQAMGVTCAAVTLGPDLLAQPQLKARGFYEELRHPVAGALHIPGLPFKVQSRGAQGWLRVPAPTFGQDNAEVLSAVCELPNEVIDQLARSSVIGDRPAGL